MNKVKRLKELTDVLHKASYAYYGQDNPIMSDKEYDNLYDELYILEKELCCVLAGSPTQKVQGFILDGFTKVQHSKPMLSANKTKDINEIKRFVGSNDYYGSYKLDGLTLVVKYNNGKFIQGITRGNGTVGEDVTEQCRFVKNLPMMIPYKEDLELRGECVISWEEFNRINETLETPYSHPRNLAAGTLRNLDLNIVRDRNLSFVVFECVSDIGIDSKCDTLLKLSNLGFEVVQHTLIGNRVEDVVSALTPNDYCYPVDGIIFEINSRKLSESLGNTSHHENCRMALKWKDELYETILRDIEWNTSKSGLVNPVAVFDPVDLEGAITSRATLHNISYIEDLELGIGDTIEVYRANMVIPKVHDNLTRSNTWKLPDKCPNCGGNVEIHNENGSKTLHCTNPECSSKLLGQLSHFVSKNAINIESMSESTIQKFMDLGWLKSFVDIYHLFNHKEEMYRLDGFGKKSVDRLLDNIQKSRNTELSRFIYALSIPLIGRSASKDIAKICCDNIVVFLEMIKSKQLYKLMNQIDGFGDAMYKSLCDYTNLHINDIEVLSEEFMFSYREEHNSEVDLSGKIFVITGSLNHYKNRDALVAEIESRGGKVSGSVSAKTSYLINNDTMSNSSKNRKAKELSIPIISENDFIKMINAEG